MLTRDLLALGRVSNLPTVWSNVLAAWVLQGPFLLSADGLPSLALLLLAMSAFYVGGMVLNDAFDAVFDARWRPERPIPSGRVSRRSAYWLGLVLLAAGVLTGAAAGAQNAQAPSAALACFALAVVILFYDGYHKGNPLSPLVMGTARLLIYFTVAVCFQGSVPIDTTIAALVLLSYVAGLTYVAKQENLLQPEHSWPLLMLLIPLAYSFWRALDTPLALLLWLVLCGWLVRALRLVARHAVGEIARAVTAMIAGISLFDAVIIAAAGEWLLSAVALLCFGLTRLWQRRVPGT